MNWNQFTSTAWLNCNYHLPCIIAKFRVYWKHTNNYDYCEDVVGELEKEEMIYCWKWQAKIMSLAIQHPRLVQDQVLLVALNVSIISIIADVAGFIHLNNSEIFSQLLLCCLLSSGWLCKKYLCVVCVFNNFI